MTNIILNGCNGKMGYAVTKAVSERADCAIVAGVVTGIVIKQQSYYGEYYITKTGNKYHEEKCRFNLYECQQWQKRNDSGKNRNNP